MPLVDELCDINQLRICIRDLVALSTLPAIWTEYDPQQIADSVAAALVSMLDADFVHVALTARHDEPLIEVTRTGKGLAAGSVGAIQIVLRNLRLGLLGQGAEIPNPIGEGTLRVATSPIGFGGDAILLAASSKPNFPSATHRLLLGIGANDATVALQRAQAESNERRFIALIERSSDFVGFAGLDGHPQYINPAGMKLLGLSTPQALPNVNILDFVALEDRARARDEGWHAVMRTGRWVGELNLRHSTGATFPVLVDWFRIDHPRTGRPMHLATVSRDLTAQKRYEAELRHLNETLESRVVQRTAELATSNRMLMAEIVERESAAAKLHEVRLELIHAGRLSMAGQLAANLAHELNQPLAAATNSLNAARRLLANGRDVDTAREIVEEAAGQTIRVGQIIRQMRAFVARGETEMKIEDLPTMIEEASKLLLSGADTQAVRVQFKFDPQAPQVLANRIQVQQVLVNLMRNSIEAMTGTGRGELTVSTIRLNEKTIEIAVADRGPGLSAAVAKRLFEPFFSTKREGMGLGLSICRSIVESHSGQLRTEPNPGGGTIFRFTLAAPSRGDVHAK
jgi:PAS domain S-box-containing protein